MKSIFEPTEYLSLVLTKLDTELGLAQPQLVCLLMSLCKSVQSKCTVTLLVVFFSLYWLLTVRKCHCALSLQYSQRITVQIVVFFSLH